MTALWRKYVGLDGKSVGIDRFGLSAPAPQIFKELGVTAEAVVAAARSLLSVRRRSVCTPVRRCREAFRDGGHGMTLDAGNPGATINRNIYGHFAEHLGRCIYEGIWVGEDSPIPHTRGIRHDVVAALKKLAVPVLRWPGGCFADEYHWRDGVGPRAERPKMINTHWGGVVENNHFGTHEFLDLCE